MPVITTDTKKKIETLRQTIASSGPDSPLATNKAEVKWIEGQRSDGLVRGFSVVQDEPESVGGTSKGPTPTDYFIASIGFCENVIFVRNASLAGLSIESLETFVTGSWDRRGLFEVENTSPFFKRINVETRVATKDPTDMVVQVAQQTHRRCPVHATLARATELVFTLVVNGQAVPL